MIFFIYTLDYFRILSRFYVNFISVRNNGQVWYFFLVLFLIFFITL